MKCIAAAGSIVASGGADDLIHIYDMHVSVHPSFPAQVARASSFDAWSSSAFASFCTCVCMQLSMHDAQTYRAHRKAGTWDTS